MHVLALGTIKKFASENPLSSSSLNDWYAKTTKADWQSPNDIGKMFNSCDYIGNDRYVFNITGNHYRLVAMIFFAKRAVYIRGILTHAQYDDYNKRGLLISL